MDSTVYRNIEFTPTISAHLVYIVSSMAGESFVEYNIPKGFFDDPQVSLLPLLQQPRNIQNMYKKLKPYMYKLGEETDYAIGAAKPERVTRYHLWPCPENAETRVERGYPHKPGDQIRLPIKWDEVPVNESKTFTESSWRSLDENAPKSNKRAGPNTKNNGSGKNGRRQGWTTNTNYKHVLNDSKGWKGRKESEREQ